MSTIITQYAPDAHLHPDEAARRRADRLATASYNQIEAALAYLSMIDPEAFEIALTVVAPSAADESEDDEAVPLCRTCGAHVGIFPSSTSAGVTSEATLLPPAPTTPTIPATLPRSPGTSPTRLRKTFSVGPISQPSLATPSSG